MPINQVRVQAPTAISGTDGSVYDQLGGKQAEGIVTDLHGKYYTQAVRGNVFMVSTIAAGLAIPISSILFLGLCIIREISTGEEPASLAPSAFAPFA